MKLFRTVIFLVFCCISPCLAEEMQIWQNDKIQIEAYQSAEKIAFGEDFQILIKIQMKNGWHIMWDNPGDVGTPTTFTWQTPQGWNVARVNESVPEKMFYNDMIVQYGYKNRAYYLFKAVPNGVASSAGHFTLKIDWLACRDYCAPESTVLTFALPASGKTHSAAPRWAHNYQEALRSFPEITDTAAVYKRDGGFFSFSLSGNFVLTKQPLYFIVQQPHIVFSSGNQEKKISDNNRLDISIEAEDESKTPTSGILIYGNQAYKYALIPFETPRQTAFLSILLLAFIGGVLLNFMPCVFPVLSIKAITLAESNVKNNNSLKNGLGYTFGVLLSFVFIAALLYLLRFHGEQNGWGFQLQSPVFVMFMLITFIIIFLLMLDIVRIDGKYLTFLTKISAESHFLTGFFAVLIASPCTGPFMGAVLGYALLQPVQVYFPVFVSLGLGYALPFALVEIFPDTIKKLLPAPGKWMNILKKAFAVPVFLTCLWLGWVLFNQYHPQKPKDTLWQPYQPDVVAQLVNEGKPVFIDFTAKWCLTCLLNEKTTLSGTHFTELIRHKKITLFKADWTSRSHMLLQSLQAYGRASVPLYVYYPGNGSYTILPQLLTPNILKKYLTAEDGTPE